MSLFVLKCIGVLAMVIDHIGLFFFPDIIELRIIGRLALPIFAFGIGEGFRHSRNPTAYGLRLLSFATLSHLPYLWAFYQNGVVPLYLNIFLTLAAGLLALAILMSNLSRLLKLLLLIIISLTATVCSFEYGHYGVLLVPILYYLRDHPYLGTIALFVLAIFDPVLGLVAGQYIQAMILIVLPLLYHYNGTKGGESVPGYVWYAFYPLHFVVLAIAGLIW